MVKVPLQLLKDGNSSFRRYKYHVETPLTQTRYISSLEFIAGIQTQTGDVIDRSMKLHIDIKMIQTGCKLVMHVSTFAYNIFINELLYVVFVSN